MWRTLLAAVVLTPVAALFVGVGVLAFNVSETWDARNTDALISGLIASCSIGGIVVAGLLAAIVGIPLATRLLDRAREADRHVAPRIIDARPGRQWREDGPPLLADRSQGGSWQSQGPVAYDLWEEPTEADRGNW